MKSAQVVAGDELPAFVVESVDAEKMKLMAALLRDPNPIHFDAESVRTLGLGSAPINQGPTNLSYVIEVVTRWLGDVSRLRHVEARFLGNVFAGDRVECVGRVREVDDSTGEIVMDVEARVQDRLVVGCSITVAP